MVGFDTGGYGADSTGQCFQPVLILRWIPGIMRIGVANLEGL